jgi:amino-acid N-acetyltransferase
VTDLTLQPATGDDLATVVDLLGAADLPHEDVRAAEARFYLAYADDRRDADPVGAAGLERCGDDGLLRSVVVAEPHRGEGHGSAVVDAVLAEARAAGVDRIYLLTTTAADFFEDRGFERLPGGDVSGAIRETREFRKLCPDSATCMWRSL